MKKLYFDDQMIHDAISSANALGSINNSILNGGGNVAGYLGEYAVGYDLGAKIISNKKGKEKYNNDLRWYDKKIEVKTKRRTVAPLLKYEVSIAETSIHQQPDIYAFVSIHCKELISKNPRKYRGIIDIWLCGYMGYNEYFEKAVYYKKGQIDKSNGFKVHRNMYNMKIGDLYEEIYFCS